jgi:hypothetical protein
MTTPAEAAKTYAHDHGFTITPEGRRYRITRTVQPSVTVGEVGGYPAALNLMRTAEKVRELLECTDDVALVGVLAPVGPDKHEGSFAAVDIASPDTDKSVRSIRISDHVKITSTVTPLARGAAQPDGEQYYIPVTTPPTPNGSTGAVKPYVITARNKTTGARFQMAQGPFLTRDEAIKRVRHLFNTVPSYRNAGLQVEYRP